MGLRRMVRNLAGQGNKAPTFERIIDQYKVSKAIAMAQTPDQVVEAMLSSPYLRAVSRASVLIFDKPWSETPPQAFVMLADWNRDKTQPSSTGERYLLEEYDLLDLCGRDEPVIIEDVRKDKRLGQQLRSTLVARQTHGLVLHPLSARGDWFGMLTVHFSDAVHPDALLHIAGLVGQVAVAIYTPLLIEVEAEAREEAEESEELKMKLLATISHELRTPLTSIKGFVTTLLADDVEWDPVSQRDFLETIDQETDKLTELVEQLLDLSRLEAGTLRVTPGRHNVRDIVATAMPQLEVLAANHQLHLRVPDGLPSVSADRRRIAQVLTNLVSNAAKYSPRGTNIVVAFARQDNHVRVDVSDEGPGIKAEERSQIFVPFRQGSRAASSGAGLGLAISRGIVQAHEGKLWIEDRDGPGTTLSFTLPTLETED